ncbi:MAG: alpha/beta fold hydrolase [Desulfovibrionaceae bacterium]|nr:alpha/beta fold hydrolase [Desulfovibrionaceae bacterium]
MNSTHSFLSGRGLSVRIGLALALTLALQAQPAFAGEPRMDEGPLVIAAQGAFSAGGTVVTAPGTFNPADPLNPAGQTLHGDHCDVIWQTPVNARPMPLVFLHGAGQSRRTWESTPDGREGFQNLFLRMGYGVYLLDQPRRGDAGRGTVAQTAPAATDDQFWFGRFRVGVWPDYFEGVQFPRDAESLNQYFRQMTPNTGPFDADLSASAVSAVFDRIGAGILVTHSQGGGPGWLAVIKNPQVKGVVAFEPGSNFVFPEGEAPAPIEGSDGPLAASTVPLDDFLRLTRVPIIIYYGDFIPETRSDNPNTDAWRTRLAMARLWAEAVNRHGGDAAVVHLPEQGIRGNTHFPFSDLNNHEIAAHMAAWLHEKKLD